MSSVAVAGGRGQLQQQVAMATGSRGSGSGSGTCDCSVWWHVEKERAVAAEPSESVFVRISACLLLVDSKI